MQTSHLKKQALHAMIARHDSQAMMDCIVSTNMGTLEAAGKHGKWAASGQHCWLCMVCCPLLAKLQNEMALPPGCVLLSGVGDTKSSFMSELRLGWVDGRGVLAAQEGPGGVLVR